MSKAADILAEAAALVDGERDRTHGAGRRNFHMTAELWSVYLGIPIKPADVATMMALMKISRSRCGAYHADHYTDLAGYAGIAGELAKPVAASLDYPRHT